MKRAFLVVALALLAAPTYAQNQGDRDCAAEITAAKGQAIQLPAASGHRNAALNILGKAEKALAAGETKRCLILVDKAKARIAAQG